MHLCHREGNVNRAAAKTKVEWQVQAGLVCGGLVRRVSPAMSHTYFEYMTTEYPRAAAETGGMLLVQLAGPRAGRWATDGARRMLGRAGERAGLGRIRPHGFRHSFATAVLDASDVTAARPAAPDTRQPPTATGHPALPTATPTCCYLRVRGTFCFLTACRTTRFMKARGYTGVEAAMARV